MVTAYVPLLALLVEDGLITQEQAAQCEVEVMKGGASLREALVKRELLSSETFTSLVAFRARVPVVDMEGMRAPLPAAKALPFEAATRLRALVTDEDADSYRVVVDDPSDAAVEELQKLLPKRLRLAVASRGLRPEDVAAYY